MRRYRVVTDRIDRNDVGMIEPRRRLGLAAKPRVVGCDGFWTSEHQLDRDNPLRRSLAGAINHAHAAAADLLENLAVADHVAGLRPGLETDSVACRGPCECRVRLGRPRQDLRHLHRAPEFAEFVHEVGRFDGKLIEIRRMAESGHVGQPGQVGRETRVTIFVVQGRGPPRDSLSPRMARSLRSARR